MNEKSREWHVQKAKELLGKVSNAKLVLSLANGEQRNDKGDSQENLSMGALANG